MGLNGFYGPTGKSDLTVDALKLHNELQSGSLELGRKDASMEEEPNEAFSEKTSGTFLSGLSDCSNLTFRKVQRYWESNSATHKEVGVFLWLFIQHTIAGNTKVIAAVFKLLSS